MVKMAHYLYTSEIAKSVGVHPNTIRLYEEWGFLPPVPRSPSGYRLFTEVHRDQMRLARTALHGGWPGETIRKSAAELVRQAAAGDLAVVQSKRPLAAVVQTTVGVADGAGNITTPYLMGNYRAFSAAANAVYLPLAARQYYNYDSGFQVQNARNGDTTFTLKYYRPGQSQPVLSLTQTVGAYHSFNFWRPQGLPPDYLGSAVVEVTSGGPVVVVGQYDKVNNAQSRYGMNQYEGVTAGTWSEILPYVQWSSPWTWTGIMAQNMGSSATDIFLAFYDPNGAWAGLSTEPGVLPRTSPVFWQEIAGFLGSAAASSNPALPLGLVVNLDRLEAADWTNKDGLMGYSAVR